MLNINRIGRIMKIFKREYPLTFVYIVIDDRTWTDLVNLHFTLNFKYKSIANKIVKYCENELNLNMSGINYEEKAFIHELGHIVLTKYSDLPSYHQDISNSFQTQCFQYLQDNLSYVHYLLFSIVY